MLLRARRKGSTRELPLRDLVRERIADLLEQAGGDALLGRRVERGDRRRGFGALLACARAEQLQEREVVVVIRHGDCSTGEVRILAAVSDISNASGSAESVFTTLARRLRQA
jgi:hypothetical protein